MVTFTVVITHSIRTRELATASQADVLTPSPSTQESSWGQRPCLTDIFLPDCFLGPGTIASDGVLRSWFSD